VSTPTAPVETAHCIIGTAGHIDHGKTSLVKALTGQDTDRLKEEKERGISIDLGFAHLDLPDGTRAGVVDVPGHERFIRNMLAGAHGIDLVLFTVAADDGVMPQTEEHLEIVHLLGVESAVFVITKVDLASEARIAEVEEEIRVITAGTPFEHAPVARFSFVTGAGLDEVRGLVADALAHRRRQPPPGYFRLPVDRVFVLQGHGLVVTGTARSGEVHLGDRVRCLPGDQVLRVRSVQVHGQSAPTAGWGQRIALNLTGAERPSIERGHVICHELVSRATSRFDATLTLRPPAARTLRNHQRVRVHIGTAERLGKVIVLGSRERAPQGGAFCQIALTEPVVALRGDRFIIRDETARRTLGGGAVIHPWARPHGRREPGLAGALMTLRDGGPAAVAQLFLDRSEEFAVPISPLHQFLDVRAEEARALAGGLPAARAIELDGERVYTTAQKWDALRSALVASLAAFHAAHPLLPGRDMEELRDRLPFGVPPKLFRAVVDGLAGERAVVRDGNLLRLPGHAATLGGEAQRLAERIRSLLAAQPVAPPDLPQIEKEIGVGRARLTEVLRVLERSGSVVRVTHDLYFLADAIEGVRRTLREEFAGAGDITPAMFRDRFGTTRKYTIPLLEYLDREGVTVRTGDRRRLKEAGS
jgi:selenocysteine-specific elongation factor